MAANTSTGDHYGRVMKELADAHGKWALAIHVLVLVAVWPSFHRIAWVVGAMATLIPLNLWVTTRLMPKRGVVVGETVRTVANIAGGVVLYHQTGWPFTMWLWLPYIALAYDGSRRITFTILLATCSVTGIAAVIDGVSWIYPVAFSTIAFLCRAFSAKRMQIAQDMFEASEKQRSELDAAHAQLKDEVAARERAEVELRHAQKLEAIGRLASGVAHEINNPLQFVASSVDLFADGVDQMGNVLDGWRTVLWSKEAKIDPRLLRELAATEASVDLPSVRTDLDDSIAMTREGVRRVSTIVRAMKDLAPREQEEIAPLDINRAIESALIVSRHEWGLIADVESNLGEIPNVPCQGGSIGQVFLNLIVNSAQAIAERVANGGERGRITIVTALDEDHVRITFADNGGGIRPSIREKVFEPFFTTKAVGSGTGQGLAIARAIVVERHGGTLHFETEDGRGTTFIVRLRIRPRAALSGPPVDALLEVA